MFGFRRLGGGGFGQFRPPPVMGRCASRVHRKPGASYGRSGRGRPPGQAPRRRGDGASVWWVWIPHGLVWNPWETATAARRAKKLAQPRPAAGFWRLISRPRAITVCRYRRLEHWRSLIFARSIRRQGRWAGSGSPSKIRRPRRGATPPVAEMANVVRFSPLGQVRGSSTSVLMTAGRMSSSQRAMGIVWPASIVRRRHVHPWGAGPTAGKRSFKAIGDQKKRDGTWACAEIDGCGGIRPGGTHPPVNISENKGGRVSHASCIVRPGQRFTLNCDCMRRNNDMVRYVEGAAASLCSRSR